MELKDFNLEIVRFQKGNSTGYGIRPIEPCLINGQKYSRNPDNPSDENQYIPVSDLKNGCIIKMDAQKQAYILQISQFFSVWYLDIWEIPYKNSDYSDQDKFEILREEKEPLESFEVK